MSKTRVAQCKHCREDFSPSKKTTVYCSNACAARHRYAAPPETRFWEKVEKTNDCWIWRGGVNWDGYGQLWFMGQCRRANRVAWFLAHGAFPEEQVLHRCDNPACVRVDHLFLGTHTANMVDMASKGRSSHRKLTPEQVRDARRRCAAGETHLAIAQSLGVKRESIRDIMSGKKWKWL